MGELLTRWTVRVALVCYVVALTRMLGTRRGDRDPGRLAWTAGLIAYLAHVVCAFHFFHDWSHAAAYRETARQTAALFGWDWGGGLYFNYVFTAVWSLDVLWWWLAPAAYRARPLWLSAGIHGFLAFMAFNGAVVFGAGLVRWAGLAACAGLLFLLWRTRRHAHDPQDLSP